MGAALKEAVRDMYDHSWRFLILNSALAFVAVAIVLAAAYARPALVLLVLVGPFAAALMHCAVTVHDTDDLEMRDAVVGLRLHWLRGLALGALAFAAAVLVGAALTFYAHRAWPLALLALYIGLAFGVWQIYLWPLAIARRGDRLADVLRDAALALVRRPWSSIVLAVLLLLVNLVGAIGVLPVLTLTLAYSALAAAHFVLPPPTEEATPTWPASPSIM